MFFAHLPRPRNKRPPMDRRAVKAQVEISNDRPNESLSVLRNENADSIVNGIVTFEAILFIVPPPPFYIRSVEVSLLEITTLLHRGWRATNRDGTHNVAEISPALQRAVFIVSTHLFASFVRNSFPSPFHRYIQFHLYPLSRCALTERNANYIITYIKPYRI